MNLGRINTAVCVNVLPPPDPRCSDPAFALANPSLCAVSPKLVIKPGTALTCALGSVQFKAFEVSNGDETDVTSETTFSSGDLNIAVISASTGNCTGLSAGDVLITATRNGLTATANLSVFAGANCCNQQKVALVVLVDTTRSMSQAFGGAYATKLDYAKAAASRFIGEINGNKDVVGLVTFHSTTTETLATITSSVSSVVTAVGTITQTQDKTELYDAIQKALTMLAAETADRKVILIISDGGDTLTKPFTADNDPILALQDFKDNGGIVMALGVRATGSGFALLSALATGGFFVSAYSTNATDSLGYLSGIKGYVCAGQCTPNGDVIAYKGAFSYASFINWNVTGTVDLIGNGFLDLLPGNGLYVDLTSNGKLVTKNTIAVVAGHDYRLKFDLAGNQTVDAGAFTVKVRVFATNGSGTTELLSQVINITDYKQDFHTYNFAFTPDADYDVYLSVEALTVPAGISATVGVLFNRVTFTDATTLQTLFTDNFDSENPVYVPPRCGTGTTYVWIPDLNHYGYMTGSACSGYGCIDEPLGVQAPDPNPISDVEISGAPPPKTYTSTQQACATCPNGTQNTSPLIPVMTSNTTPSGHAYSSSVFDPSFDAWNAFARTGGAWSNAPGDAQSWLGYGFTAAQAVSAYSVSLNVGPDIGDPLASYNLLFQGSNEGTAWTTLDTQSVVPNAVFATLITLSAPATYSYFRLIFSPSGYVLSVTQFQVFGVVENQVCMTATATSSVSQADADSKAYAAALVLAQAGLNCTSIYTATASYTSKCPFGQFGADVTKTVTKTSTVSEQAAFDAALAEAKLLADAALDCTQSNNTSPITVIDATNTGPSKASPFPSVKHVTGGVASITKVTVKVNLLSHASPYDLQMLLTAPDGTSMILMSRAGGRTGVANINLVFDDAAGAMIPSGPNPGDYTLVSGTFKPSQYPAAPIAPRTFPAPAPQAPYAGTTLAVFAGKDSNGSWALSVIDSITLDTGTIGSWDLTIT